MAVCVFLLIPRFLFPSIYCSCPIFLILFRHERVTEFFTLNIIVHVVLWIYIFAPAIAHLFMTRNLLRISDKTFITVALYSYEIEILRCAPYLKALENFDAQPFLKKSPIWIRNLRLCGLQTTHSAAIAFTSVCWVFNCCSYWTQNVHLKLLSQNSIQRSEAF